MRLNNLLGYCIFAAKPETTKKEAYNGNAIKNAISIEFGAFNELTKELSIGNLRLMLDPQKETSPEAVIEDLVLYLQDIKNGKPNIKTVKVYSAK